jgi:Tat protein translocase TatB subunit
MDFLGIGLPELLVILLLTVIVVGPQRLPQMAAELARFLRAFRRYSARITQEFNETMADLEKEYDEMKGEWKEIGRGLDESAKAVSGELAAAGRDARGGADGGAAPAPPESTPPPG